MDYDARLQKQVQAWATNRAGWSCRLPDDTGAGDYAARVVGYTPWNVVVEFTGDVPDDAWEPEGDEEITYVVPPAEPGAPPVMMFYVSIDHLHHLEPPK